MNRNHLSAMICRILAVVIAFSATFSDGAFAQASIGDFEIPTITSAADLTELSDDGMLNFEISVSDNVAISEVTLYYRYTDSGGYASIPLQSLDSDRYAATLSSAEAKSINYYVTVTDTSGNTTRRGNSFFPIVAKLTRTVSAGSAFTQSKTLYYVLGALALGALAGLAGSSGGSSSIENNSTNCCTVTINTTPQ